MSLWALIVTAWIAGLLGACGGDALPPAPARKPPPAAPEAHAGGTKVPSPAQEDRLRENAELQARCDGDAVASCTELGNRLREGWDLDGSKDPPQRKPFPPEPDAALAAYERGCSHAVPDACAQLGFLYEHGIQVPSAPERAIDLYQRACDAGSARGCSRLGAFHLHGPRRDLARAHAFSEAGCKGKDPLGCINLGVMHRRGEGVAKNDKRASELFHTACMLDEALACTLLAELYGAGEGVDQSPQLAAMFNQRGCAFGDARGCGNLGVSHQLGFGVERDEKRAAFYFERACKGGEQRYCALLRRFEQEQAAR